ncbi:MAG: GDSL-type esterase/lipase family protein [Puia sp.]|nr:GDSL-type esterase/lipase family protein [Puia sp.]
MRLSEKSWIKDYKSALVLLLVLLLSAFVATFFLTARKQSLLIVFIGDSITYGAGLGDPLHEAPPVAACDTLGKMNGIVSVDGSNQGVSGFTTVDFLPSTGTAYRKAVQAAAGLLGKKGSRGRRAAKNLLLFSIMLGTNDSAIEGPNGSPVSPSSYKANLQTLCDSLLDAFPGCRIVINRPVWYSPNTYNGAKYLAEGLERLQAYFPEIDSLVAGYAAARPGHVYAGDKGAFSYFEKNYQTDFQSEKGRQGTFFLHPNEKGAVALGRFWADAIYKAVK